MRILQIKQNKILYKVTTDLGEYFLSEETMIQFFIRKEKEFTTSEWNDVLEYDKRARILSKAINYALYKLRTVHEMNVYLQKKEIVDTSFYIEELKKRSLLNDEAYIEQLYMSMMDSKKGFKYFEEKAKSKGVPFQLIAPYRVKFERVEEDTVIDVLSSLIRPKQTSLAKHKQQLLNKLITKGFSYGTAKSAIEELSDEIYEATLEEEAILKELAKLKKEDPIKQKQKLKQKGYSYELVSQLIDKTR